MSSEPRKRRRRAILAALAVVVLVLGGGAAFVLTHRQGDVSHPNVEFRAEPTPTQVPDKPESLRQADRFAWPMYGLTKDRRRFLPASGVMRPPFKHVWTFRSTALLEFPPVMARGSLYTLNDDGVLYAITKRTGQARWRIKLGSLAAASPAINHGRVFAVLLSRHGRGNGRAVCLRASDGKILWSRDLPSRSESSPLVEGQHVYFGSENGTVYALGARTGQVLWTFRARGAVKAAVALAGGRIFFGDYAGKLYALRAGDGHLIWEASTKGARFGFAAGRFYSTPAVAYGRVYIGNVDGNVYSFATTSGQLAWRHHTSGYVYSSPAVGQAPGDRPTVYVGSYDGNFYALDARSGNVRWSHRIGGKISGGATLLGDIVYFSDLANRRTFGLGARTGREVFRFPHGGYNPVVSDGRTVFLTGYASLYALRPLSAQTRKKIAKRRRARHRAHVAARRAAHRRDLHLQYGCRARAQRLHHGHPGAVRRSFRHCVHARRTAATRRACRRIALRAHRRHRHAVARSVRRCVARHRR